jgi:hypothetical protein
MWHCVLFLGLMMEDSDSSDPETEDGTDVDTGGSESESDGDITELLLQAQQAIAQAQLEPVVVDPQHDDSDDDVDEVFSALNASIAEANLALEQLEAVIKGPESQSPSCEDSYIQLILNATPFIQLLTLRTVSCVISKTH